jgi:hypothetical protein
MVPSRETSIRALLLRIALLAALAGSMAFAVCVPQTADAGGVATTSGNSSSAAATPSPDPTFNVFDYGAAADGATDDRQAIKDAASAAAAAGGGVVYLPAGTYLLYDYQEIGGANAMEVNLTLRDHVTFKGDGIGRTILHSVSSDFVSVFGSTGGTDLHVEDMTLDTDPARHTGDGDGIKLQDVTDSSFTNVAAQYFYIDFMVYGSRDVTFTGCTARGRRSAGTGTSMNFVVDSFSPEVFPDSDHIRFVDCESYESQQCGFWAYIAKGGSDSFRVKNVTYVDCYAHDNDGAGFYSKWSYRVTWRGCRSYHNGWGYYLVHAKEYLVKGCEAGDNAEGGDAVPYDAGDSRSLP